jgi:hypothetical protein
MRRPPAAGMTGVAGGGKGAKVAAFQAAAARPDTGRTATKRKAEPKLAILAKAAKRVTLTKKAKKVSGASKKRKRG